MKIYAKIIVAALLVAVAAGCEPYKVSGLDNSVDARINELIDSYVDELIGTDDEEDFGWLGSIKTNEGYYQYWFDFHPDGKVDIFTDNWHYPALKIQKDLTATYTFRAFQRPTLTFDTYSFIHLMNDPDNNISKGNNNKGLETDFEFEVVRYDPEQEVFHMQGRFNKVNAIFRKASKPEKEGVEKGRMMDAVLTTYENEAWANKYIVGQNGGDDFIMKLSDMRTAYIFKYDGTVDGSSQGEGYYTVDPDGSGNLRLPEPTYVGDIEVGGVHCVSTQDTNENITYETFDKFIGTDGSESFSAQVMDSPPASLRIADLLGIAGEDDGRMFNDINATGVVPPSGASANAVNWLPKFFSLGNTFNLVFSCNHHYFFRIDEHTRELWFHMEITPLGTGIAINPDSGQQITAIMSYEMGGYKFKVSNLNWENMSFTLNNDFIAYGIGNSTAADLYYKNNGPAAALINGIRGRDIQIRWSTDVKNPVGLMVDLWPVSEEDASYASASTVIANGYLFKNEQ
jgi:hypothetical protein